MTLVLNIKKYSTKNVEKEKLSTLIHPFHSQQARKNGKGLLKLVNHYFDKSHTYKNIFYRNKIKLSYSCIVNFKSEILNHDNNILNETTLRNKKEVATTEPNHAIQKLLKLSTIYKSTISFNNTAKFVLDQQAQHLKTNTEIIQ